MQSALNIHGMCVPAEPRMSNTFPRILAAFIPTDSPMPYNPTQLSESCQGFHGPSIDLHYIYFMHYVFTQILRYSHAVLDCVSMKAEVWTCPDMSGLVSKRLDLRDRCCHKPTSRSQRLLSVHFNAFIFFILALVAVI
ncbi:hypothetical protein T10_1441 [Trichinella papuae]|uniref:Uncharacterized protein n=1 Tax=Trichinella papuae TaxID=268474 RepID=A0A0V1MJU7_9BILA|nr:hypothetical protein T10_1441 [Trichinella papuae]